MSMTPEERAKGLVPLVFSESPETTAFRERAATAIRHAENEKLEEALEKIGAGFWAVDPAACPASTAGAVWMGMKPDEMIETIRSLKSKD